MWDGFRLSFCGRKPSRTRAILCHVGGAGSITEWSTWYPGASWYVSKFEILPYPNFTSLIKVPGVIFFPSQCHTNGFTDGHQKSLFRHLPFSPPGPQLPSQKGYRRECQSCKSPEKKVQPAFFSLRLATSFGKLLHVLMLTRSLFYCIKRSFLVEKWGSNRGPCPVTCSLGFVVFFQQLGLQVILNQKTKANLGMGENKLHVPPGPPGDCAGGGLWTGEEFSMYLPSFWLSSPRPRGFHKHYVAQFQFNGTESFQCVLITQT